MASSRRRWSPKQKLAMVREILEPRQSMSVMASAQRH
ncbi:transposase [Pseudomonas umsongensis]|nr:transposase [Pseudomonas umsongensis]